MADLVTWVALALVGVAVASYCYRWRSAGWDSRLGDGLFIGGVAVVLFADEVLSGGRLDVALVVGGLGLVVGLLVKVVRPFTPALSQ